MLSSSGGGMSVLIHSNVAMEGFVSMRRYKGDEEEEEDHVVGKHHQQQVEENGNGSESSSFGVEEESSLSLSSSSLGADEDEAQSELREEDEEDVQDDALASLEDLEDSLPVKRGLSNHFNGKAKSFSSLADVITNPTAAADLAKREHPFNKRRRILMAAKKRRDSWPRRGSCGSLDTLPHPPLIVASELRVLEEVDEEDDGSGRGGGGDSPRLPPLPVMRGRDLKSFRSPRCFSLTNLQQHDEFS